MKGWGDVNFGLRMDSAFYALHRISTVINETLNNFRLDKNVGEEQTFGVAD